ncbi:MAG: hypothetical protein ACTMUB_06770 [cyanobacterium endosymbiont of Rhopalodia musculus]|nr:hypothetical protein [cyanobacterium endosymbiont of Epithemia clementina EcSB]WGT67809.1 hypothetical protein P3F56_01585 [cyanobacterium endosymbiont of Epithemia clementina EcSB]
MSIFIQSHLSNVEVYAADQLFATFRVGLIQEVPLSLVNAFEATPGEKIY